MPHPPTDPLPSETEPHATARVVGVTLAAVAALLLLTNAAVPSIDRRVNRSSWLLEKKWELLEHPGRKIDLLVLGDSSGNQAVNPAVVQARLGASTLNVCTFGFMAVAGDAWMLEEFIRLHGAPRAVVAVHVHDIWPRVPDPTSAAAIPRPWSFWRGRQPPLLSSARDQVSFAMARYLPLYVRTFALSRLVQHPLDVFDAGFALEPDGFMPARWQSDLAAQARGYVDAARTNRFSVSPVNRAAVGRMLALAEERGFDLFIASGPLYRPIYQDEAFRRYVEQRNIELDRMVAGSRRGRILFRTPPLLEAEHLEGVDHPNVEGARLYSELLAKALEEAHFNRAAAAP